MLYGLLLTAFIIISVLLVLIIMIQQGKSSMGIGGIGGGAQMLFGGSGGQDIFQKSTWVLGAIFMVGSLALALVRSHDVGTSRYVGTQQQMSQEMFQPEEVPAPVNEPAE
jgi:preprotein translocase subunit SecG